MRTFFPSSFFPLIFWGNKKKASKIIQAIKKLKNEINISVCKRKKCKAIFHIVFEMENEA